MSTDPTRAPNIQPHLPEQAPVLHHEESVHAENIVKHAKDRFAPHDDAHEKIKNLVQHQKKADKTAEEKSQTKEVTEQGQAHEELTKEKSQSEKRGLLASMGMHLPEAGEVGEEASFDECFQKFLSGFSLVGEETTAEVLKSKSQSEWLEFFKNMTEAGNVNTPQSVRTADIAKLLFRGLIAQEEEKLYLVSDVHIKNESQEITDKFARISLSKDQANEMLSKLSPGVVLSQDHLKKLGTEISYTQLTHQPDVLTGEARVAARAAALAHMRNPNNPRTLRNFEDYLLSGRKKNNSFDFELPLSSLLFQSEKIKSFDRLPKFWLWILYGTVGSLLAIVLFSLFRDIF